MTTKFCEVNMAVSRYVSVLYSIHTNFIGACAIAEVDCEKAVFLFQLYFGDYYALIILRQFYDSIATVDDTWRRVWCGYDN